MSIADQLTKQGERVIDWNAVLSTPKAASTKCSFLQAVATVGFAKFGTAWSGEELHATYWPDQPIELERRRSEDAHRRRSSPVAPVSLIRYPQPAPKPLADIDPEKLATLRAQSIARQQEAWERNQEALQRLRFSVDWLAQQCRDGVLKSFWRLEAGGDLGEMSAGDWNIDHPLSEFARKGGYDRWFVSAQSRKRFVYIFFDRDELERAVAVFAHSASAIPPAQLGRLSPYLQFAVKLALRKEYFSADTDDTAPTREAEVKQAWAEGLPGIPMSNSAVTMIASIMGFPDVRAIERSLEGAANRKNGGIPPKTRETRDKREG